MQGAPLSWQFETLSKGVIFMAKVKKPVKKGC